MRKIATQLFVFTMLLAQFAFAQERRIKGTVTSGGEPVPYISVLAKGTTLGVSTDAAGNYEFTVPQSAKTLVFSGLGYKTKEVDISNGTVFNVDLESDALQLNEVVVTAIGITREKKALGYSTQEVNPDEIVQSRESNLVNGLSGKLAGVTVTNSSGAAGSAAFIAIRGMHSIVGDNSPLFVVDGIPIDNSENTGGNPDNGTNNQLFNTNASNRALDLNPDDIENVNVLKGPAATALYGIRAANGAVIITTKKGRATSGGGINVSYSTSLGWDMVDKLPELQNDFAQGTGGKYRGPETHQSGSWGPKIDTMVYDNSLPYTYDKNGKIVSKSSFPSGAPVKAYDNLGNYFRTGTTYTNTLGFGGGNEKGTYYFSAGSLGQNGIIPNNDFHRYTFRASGDLKLSDKFSIGSSANYIKSGGTRIEQGSNTSGVMLGLLRTPITFDNRNGVDPSTDRSAYMFSDGTERTYRGVGVNGAPYGFYDNPYWVSYMNPTIDDVNRLIGNTTINYTPVEWLKATYRVGIDFYSDRRKHHYAINSANAQPGQITEDQWFNRNFNQDILLTAEHTFSDKFNGGITIGNNMYSSYSERLYSQGDGLSIPEFYNMSNATSVFTRESYGRLRRAAFYADAHAGFMNMLYLDATLRNEWTTTLPEGNNSFLYPSASLGFVFTEPLHLSNNNVFPFGKLRISYASVGNDVSPYATSNYFTQGFYQDGWTNGVGFPFNGAPGYMLNDIAGNSNLKPEKENSFEAGLDLRFFSNRLTLDVTYYDTRNTDVILPVPISAASGYLQAYLNAATIQNKGWEIVATGSPVKTKNFEWKIGVNFAKNDNKVLELAPGVETYTLGGFQGATIRAVVGQPFGVIYGHGWLRDKNGNRIINDVVGDPKYGYPILNDNEQSFGSVFPNWTMGIRNTFTFKGFTLSALLDIRNGGYIWNGTRSALNYFGRAAETDNRGTSTVFDGVKGHVDDQGNVVATSTKNDVSVKLDQSHWYQGGDGNGFITNNTEDFIEKSDWVRLRELTLSYRFQDKVFGRTGLKGVELSVTARNLWLSTKYKGVDPETSLTGSNVAQGLDYFNMPSTKSVVVGLKVNL
jgi:TonB-linked SusC/RagA family outer membrane protein